MTSSAAALQDSLQVLADRLVSGPPSLDSLLQMFDDEGYQDFRELVQEYLPEHEREILSARDDGDKLCLFYQYFCPRYFILSDGPDEYCESESSLSEFCYLMPVDLYGFSTEDYESLADRSAGLALMAALVSYPYYKEKSERLPFLEMAQESLGEKLFKKVPGRGWTAKQLHALADGTPYSAIADWADWLHSSTGCCQLNACYEEYEMEQWNRGTVEQLTLERPELERIMTAVGELERKITNEESIFVELVKFLLKRSEKIKIPPHPDDPPQSKTLMEIFADEKE